MKLTKMLSIMALCASTASAQTNLGTGIDRANMNLKANPGTDFFEYAAGGWNNSHPLTPEHSRYAQFDLLTEQTQKNLRGMIEQLAEKNAPQGTIEQKIGSLYRLATDSVRRNQEDYAPIKPFLAEIDAIKSRQGVQFEVAKLLTMGIGTFFALGCEADLKDSEWNLMQLYQDGLSMGERDYYFKDDEATQKVREAFKTYVAQLFSLTGCNAEDAARNAQTVMALETKLAEDFYDAVKLRDVEGNYHKMTYRTLLEDFPGIDWGTVMLLNGIPSFENICVGQPEAIRKAEKILAEESIDDLKVYLTYKVLDNAASSLSDRFREATFNFYQHAMSGAEQDKPRWKRGIDVVNHTLGMAIGKVYVEKYFPETSKQRMTELVRNLQHALSERIDAQKWMSPETKQKAHEKLNAFRVKIGYPDTWMDYSKLDIDDKLSFYENLLRARRFMSDYYVEKRVNKRVDRDEWLMTPQTVNAYYNPTTNEICFPAGILQPPFFQADADDACNYGAIGVVIGHEMTHGFDDQGSQFDKDGNLSNWWTEADAKSFKERTTVMEHFFNNLEVLPGLNCNGKLTLGENIADHGGLQISFTALQNAMKEHPLPTLDGFTPEQRFFLSYGLIWGNNIREEALRQRVMTDPHSPGKLRVNGALPHIDAWYEAFHITKKSPLFVPKKERVDVW